MKRYFLILLSILLITTGAYASGEFSELNFKTRKDLVDIKGELTSGTIVRVSAASYIDADGVLQTADGDSTPFSHSSVENETSYTSRRGSFVDDQAWFDGLIPTALSNNVTGITKANPGVVSSVAHGLSVGDLVYFDSLTEMTELNYKAVAVSAVGSADVFSVNDTSGYGAAETTGGACGHSVVSLEDYASTGNLLIVDDGSANKAYGYIGEAGTGEALGSDLFDANKGTFTEASLLLTEQIVNQVARDFSGASSWTNISWNAYDETDDLTVTATAADQYCLLLNSEISNEQIGLHVLEVDVANLVSTVDVRFGATWATGIVLATITSNGADQKFYTYLDSVMGSGMIFVGANENDSSADLDNFSLKAIDISWTRYGTNTIEIDSDALKITYVDSANGAYLFLKNSGDLSADLEIGKLYKLTGQAKVGAGDSVIVGGNGGTGSLHINNTITSTSFVSFEGYFVADSTTGCYLITISMGAGESIWLDNLVLTEVTEPNANAVHIYKEYSLTTEGWNAIDSGIDYNADSSWDFDVYTNLMSDTGGSAEARFETNGLLSEGEGTNFQLYSQDSSGWTNAGSYVVSTGHDDPSGGSDAFRMQATAGGGTYQYIWQQESSHYGDGNKWTLSAYVKNISNNEHVTLAIRDATASGYEVQIKYSVTGGVFAVSSEDVGAGSVESLGNGWYRLIATTTATSSGNEMRAWVFGHLVGSAPAGTIQTDFYGIQLEKTPYATSYIPTTTIPVTRTADSHSWTMSTAFKNLMGDTADSPFTMVAEWTPKLEYGDVVVSKGIVAVKNSENNLFGMTQYGTLISRDGTAASGISLAYSSGVTYVYALRVYDNSGMEFEVGEEHGGSWTWDATPVDPYDGSFNPSTYLIIGSDNGYPFNIGYIKFYNSAKPQIWIESEQYLKKYDFEYETRIKTFPKVINKLHLIQ